MSGPTTSPKDKGYDYTHYEKFTPDEWKAAIEKGEFPGNETAQTLLIGAYLIRLHKSKKIDAILYGGEFQKLRRLAKLCIEYFEEQYPNNGFSTALQYLKWFMAHGEGTFIASSRWSLELMLTKTSYRNYTPDAQVKSDGLSRNNMGTTIQKDGDRSSVKMKRR